MGRKIRMKVLEKVGLGGGCHWCTEAVFQPLKGVQKVDQGFVASFGNHSSFSEAVIVYFDTALISLKRIVEIHLHTHSCTSIHNRREKYRSAVYTFNEKQKINTGKILQNFQGLFNEPLITQVLPFKEFKLSSEEFQNYYRKNPKRPFCQTYIEPKLRKISREFSENI